jgi:uncharacterized protein (DUF488 family)
MPLHVLTVGHSTHDLESFVALLRGQGVELLADVRTAPRSRRVPHFDGERLAASLAERGLGYRHLPALGGWRRARPDSPNAAWRDASFRGYADYMLTSAFAEGLAELRELAAAQRTAIMCAEAAWWRCHRRLVADRLVTEGHEVDHIAPDGRLTRHELPPFAEVRDGELLYPRWAGSTEPAG